MRKTDWISVKDRLPRKQHTVLVCRQNDIIMWVDFATYVKVDNNTWYWYDQQGFDIHDVTHWQKIVLPKKK